MINHEYGMDVAHARLLDDAESRRRKIRRKKAFIAFQIGSVYALAVVAAAAIFWWRNS